VPGPRLEPRVQPMSSVATIIETTALRAIDVIETS
jgi:hypothetical protein